MINETAIIDEDLFTSKIKENSPTIEKKEIENKKPKLDLPKSSNNTVATIDKMNLKISQISIGQQSFEINAQGISRLVKKIQESLKNNDQKTLQEIGSALESLNNLNFLFVILKDLLGNNSKAQQLAVRKTLANLTLQTQAKIFNYAQENKDSDLTIENIFNNSGLKKSEINLLNEDLETLQIEIAKLKISDKSNTIALGGKGFASEKDILMLDKLITQLDPQSNTAKILDMLFQQDGQKYRFSENFSQKVQSAELNDNAQKLIILFQLAENKIYLTEDDLNGTPVEEKIEALTKHIQVTGNIFILDNLPKTWQEIIENKIINDNNYTEKDLVNLLLDSRKIKELSNQAKKNKENTLSTVIDSLDLLKKTPFIGSNFTNFSGTLIKARQNIDSFNRQLFGLKQTILFTKNNFLKMIGQNPELKQCLEAVEQLVGRIEKAELEFASGIIGQDVFERRVEYAVNQLSILAEKLPESLEKPEKLTMAFVNIRDTIQKNNLKINSLTFQILNAYLSNNQQEILASEFTVQKNTPEKEKTPETVQQEITVILNDFSQKNNFSEIIKVIQKDTLSRQATAEKLLHERLEFDRQLETRIKKNKEALSAMEKITQTIKQLLEQINKTKLVSLISNIQSFLNLLAKEKDLSPEIANLIKDLEELKVKMRERFPEIFK